MSFAKNLRREMDRAGMDVKALAQKMHASKWTVYHWREGRQVPHAEVVGEVADVLGCTCDDLIRGRR